MQILLIIFLLSGALPNTDDSDDLYQWILNEDLNFDMAPENYDDSKIYFFHQVIEKGQHENANPGSFTFIDHARPLDIYNYWGETDEQQYEILFTKTAYTLNKHVSYFNEGLLSDESYISETMPHAKVHKSDTTYTIKVGFGSPDIDYSLKFFEDQSFENKYPELEAYFQKHDGLSSSPSLVALQHNFSFSRVLFHKTSKMSISISRYFPVGDKTLVLNYTLNYIYNMPPGFIGGSDYLVDEIKKGIYALIRETKKLSKAQ